MKVWVLTLFPEMVEAALGTSMLKRARDKRLVEAKATYIRDFAEGRHLVTDDYPFGGGQGLVMKPEPIFRAVQSVLGDRAGRLEPGGPTRVVLMCPQGEVFTQQKAWELSRCEELVFVCGHYEGVDERVRTLCTDELSIGDYVLTGGELPALVVVDAVARLIPGVLAEGSPLDDSFAHGILEGPQYTRPREFQGLEVPLLLLSGHHEQVRRWRRKEALRRTVARRPELLRPEVLTHEDRELLAELAQEAGGRPGGPDGR